MSLLNSKKGFAGLFIVSILLIAGCGSAVDTQTSGGKTVTTGPSNPNGYYMSLTVNPVAIKADNDVSVVAFVFSNSAMTTPVTTGVSVRIYGIDITSDSTGAAITKVTITGTAGQVVTVNADVDNGMTIGIPVTILP